MNCEKTAQRTVDWLKEKGEKAHSPGAVFGMSGGIDSAVVAALALRAFPQKTLGIIMPCESNPEDAADAVLASEALGLPYMTADLTPAFHELLGLYQSLDPQNTAMAIANIKPRLRMTTLYYFASVRNSLVLGTGNRSELTIGYFTKYGDGGTDLLPIGRLVKEEVWELARYLGVPEKLITKPPSAGLWANQTDEGEMGMTYRDLDRFIRDGEGEASVRQKVEALHKASQHKRETPPVGPDPVY